jgi:predicted nucleic acid-binding protein
MTPIRGKGLLVDSNLLVLYVVGTVNRNRIENFKRTCQYRSRDYDLLLRTLGNFETIYTLAHVMAEVSNLTDLAGQERLLARRILKQTVDVFDEEILASRKAANHPAFERLGLTDAAIACAALELNCAVLTDDLDLYLHVSATSLTVYNFTHLRTRDLG